MSMERLPEMGDLWQETLNWQPNSQQQAQFQQFYELIVAGNRQLNLTRITEPLEFWEKHLWDSLRGIFPSVNQEFQRVIDIGTGAGFPGVPMAIAQPTWQVTLLDSTRKKINFLQESVRSLKLSNIRMLVDRVEQVGHHPSHREVYDVATIRAVAAASVCAEYTLPLLKVGGLAILYRGQWTTEEEIALSQAAEKLGGTIAACEQFETPMTHGIRHCLYLRKVGVTPEEFPRAIGVPTQNPLG